jgi:zinc transporter ZupT
MHLIPLVYALIAGLSDLVAGWLALRWRSDGFETRYVIAFAAGTLIAVTFVDILPEVRIERDYGYLALGFFTFYLLEKTMMIHACGEAECEVHAIGPVAVVGMALDNVIDGVGIAAGFLISPALGLLITLAVVFHEIPQGITSALIMREARWSRRKIFLTLGLAGGLYPLGALLAGLIPEELIPIALAFIAGDFLYIGASDLLPEAHRRFNLRVVLSLLLGVGLVALLQALTPAHGP